MNLPLQWFIPDSLQIQIRAGSVHIRTALWYITVRSIPSRVTADKMLAREETMESRASERTVSQGASGSQYIRLRLRYA